MSEHRLSRFLGVLILTWFISIPRLFGAGVTLITHGLWGDVSDWVTSMAGAAVDYPTFPSQSKQATWYKVYFDQATGVLSWRRIAGAVPTLTDSAEVFIVFDWGQFADGFDYDTGDIAPFAAVPFLQTNFISELNGRALGELPIHLLGHSRGGSLVCELSRILGTNGMWVDHLTTLDPHPLNNDGFYDFPFTVVDAPARTYENVLFHDNFYQTMDLIADGEPVSGAYNHRLNNLSGGYDSSHSDVHLWYHGTIDLKTPTDDWVETLTSSERFNWWTGDENYGATAGFCYSLIGRGNRLSSDEPAGYGTGSVRDGYNQRWDFGAGQSANRSLLPRNNGRWPNIIQLKLTGTNVMRQGDSNAVTVFYQWVQPTNSKANLSVFLDNDFNPYNGNEQMVLQRQVSGATTTVVYRDTFTINVGETNTTPGYHSLYARISGGGRTRYLYAPEILTLFPRPPRITAQPSSATVIAGTDVALSAGAMGVGPLSYQWCHDGIPIEGATTLPLRLLAVSDNNAGNYFVIVSNAGGAVTSSVATVHVAYMPVVHLPSTNQTLLIGDSLSIPVTVDGTGPFTYRWFWNNRILPTQTSATLTLGNIELKQRGTYSVEVRNSVGVQNASITVQVFIPPTIISQPRSTTVTTGKRAVLRASAKGSKPISYQWLKDGIEIPGATAKTFIIPSAQAANAGTYTVRVSNPGATRISGPGVVTVLP